MCGYVLKPDSYEVVQASGRRYTDSCFSLEGVSWRLSPEITCWGCRCHVTVTSAVTDRGLDVGGKLRFGATRKLLRAS